MSHRIIQSKRVQNTTKTRGAIRVFLAAISPPSSMRACWRKIFERPIGRRTLRRGIASGSAEDSSSASSSCEPPCCVHEYLRREASTFNADSSLLKSPFRLLRCVLSYFLISSLSPAAFLSLSYAASRNSFRWYRGEYQTNAAFSSS